MLKGETAGIWVLNVQLALYGIVIAFVGVMISDGDTSEWVLDQSAVTA